MKLGEIFFALHSPMRTIFVVFYSKKATKSGGFSRPFSPYQIVGTSSRFNNRTIARSNSSALLLFDRPAISCSELASIASSTTHLHDLEPAQRRIAISLTGASSKNKWHDASSASSG